jgi:hypothetical protein
MSKTTPYGGEYREELFTYKNNSANVPQKFKIIARRFILDQKKLFDDKILKRLLL